MTNPGWNVTVDVPVSSVAAPFVQGKAYWESDPDVYLMAEASLRDTLEAAVNAATREQTAEGNDHDAGEPVTATINKSPDSLTNASTSKPAETKPTKPDLREAAAEVVKRGSDPDLHNPGTVAPMLFAQALDDLAAALSDPESEADDA